MRILVLTDRFLPEISPPCFRVMDHAQEWLKAGHEVTVVTCAPNEPHGRLFQGYRNRLWQEEWIEGVRVIRLWSYMAETPGTLKRSLDYASFALSAMAYFWKYPPFDVILASSPPLFVPLSGYVVSRLRRRPWIFELRDLWPATMEAVGVGRGWMLRLLTKLEMFLYRRADRIVSVTEAFRTELAQRGIPAGKNDVVTNGVDTKAFNEDRVLFDARERLGVPRSAFLAGYIGTVGMCHGLETLLDAAELCRDEPDVTFLILGEGAARTRLEEHASRRGLTRVLFRNFVPHEHIPSYLAALDVSIIHLKPHPVFKTVIPSKIFESMAMGTPMVHAVEGQSAQIVAESGAGVCIPSGNPSAMADAIRQLRREPERVREMAARGKQAVAQHFSRRVKAQQMVRSFEATLSGKVCADSPPCCASGAGSARPAGQSADGLAARPCD